MAKEIPFKISSALKNLIGKELITDEFVAVFELVKNSFDANAKKVEVIFENQTDLKRGKIIIIDDGKGMNEDDLKNKWLFVAYSAKKDGSENKDYRDKIKVSRIFAGAKGVGRFSCDRLGRHLSLVSIKNENGSSIENLIVNWEDFELDPKKEFVNVKVNHQTLTKSAYPHKHGTVLEITGIRDVWDRSKLLKLKKSLAKLINPNQENDSKNFQVTITAISEINDDKKAKHTWEKVNGLVKNDVFEDLKIKTTRLKVEIIKNGTEIKSTLEDRGDKIYTLVEKNPFNELLKDISVQLFQLNQSAKITFTRTMGMEPIRYGSVFMYKNGFRIYPFGEPGEDLLLIDNRKQQGYNRFLGTRDLIGRIEINGENPELRETTSRDGGLVKTETYNQLVLFFYDYVLKRLENYSVNVIKWGDEKFDKDTGELIHPELWAKDVKIQILELISGFIKSENVISIDYDKNFLKIIESKQDKSVDKIIKNISKIGAKSQNKGIIKEAAKIGKVVKEIKADNVKKEKENIKLKEEKEVVRTELELEKQKNIYLSVRKPLSEDAEKLLHSINFNLIEIDEKVIELINTIKSKTLSKEILLMELTDLKFFTEKSRKIAEIATRANYKYEAESHWIDIPTYLKEYLSIYNDIKKGEDKSAKNIEISVNSTSKFKKYISPIQIAMLTDNLISNAIKWKDDGKKTSIHVDIKNTDSGKLEILFSDNGKGVLPKFLKIPNKIFELGITETKGTGIGLNSAQLTLDELGGKIEFVGNGITKLKGACFKITINK